MKIDINCRNIELTKAMSVALNDKFDYFEKYLKQGDSIKISVAKEKALKIKCALTHCGHTIRIEQDCTDFYDGVNDLYIRVKETFWQKKDAINPREKKKRDNSHYKADVLSNRRSESVTKRKNCELEAMTEDEAISEMLKLDRDCFMYRDCETDVICTLYKNKDQTFCVMTGS